ncbi:MAG: ABC transporter substrate-binding protein [Gemmatimonadaceae bacterium]|nr:ABC transporter substrate-binding protein [Gemmatimonadaceae bacterium]
MMRTQRLPHVALLVAMACTGGESSPTRRTLIDSRDTYDPRSLDPALSTDVPTGRAVGYVFDGLVRFTPDAQVVPGLARAWDVSTDGLTYTFHLRTGVKFHDGRPFVARNVVNSFRRVLDPATKGGRGWPLYPIAGAKDYADGKGRTISGMSAPNDTTVVITLTEPLAIFPKLLAMPVAAIVPDSVPSNFGERPVGTGPWKFVEWKHDDYIRFARNDAYFDGAPKADSLMARIVPEPSTAVAEFESGNVDVLYVPEGETRNWEETDEKKAMLESAPALRMMYIAINTTRGPLADVRVRQALNYATDARGILNGIMSGRGNLSAGVVPPALPGGDSTRKGYTRDVAKAKQLLAAAGHRNGIDLELWSSQTPPFPRIAQTVQANLLEAGVRVKLVQRDASSMREAARAGQTDLALKDWFADYPDAENFLYPLLHSANKGVGGNVSFYSNGQFDDLVARSRREQDEPKRVSMYSQADQMAFNDAPMIYLFFYRELYAVQPWIKAFKVPTIFTGQRWTDVQIQR